MVTLGPTKETLCPGSIGRETLRMDEMLPATRFAMNIGDALYA